MTYKSRNGQTVIALTLFALALLSLATFLVIRSNQALAMVTRNEVEQASSGGLEACFPGLCFSIAGVRTIEAKALIQDTEAAALSLLDQFCKEDVCIISVESSSGTSVTGLVGVHERLGDQLSPVRVLASRHGQYYILRLRVEVRKG